MPVIPRTIKKVTGKPTLNFLNTNRQLQWLNPFSAAIYYLQYQAIYETYFEILNSKKKRLLHLSFILCYTKDINTYYRYKICNHAVVSIKSVKFIYLKDCIGTFYSLNQFFSSVKWPFTS